MQRVAFIFGTISLVGSTNAVYDSALVPVQFKIGIYRTASGFELRCLAGCSWETEAVSCVTARVPRLCGSERPHWAGWMESSGSRL